MEKKRSKPPAAAKLSLEEALKRLEEIVGQLEDGDLGLNESLARYEQGVKLLRQCYDLLEGAERRIELVTSVDSEGNPVTTPLDDSTLSLDEKAQARSRRRSSPETGPSAGGPSGPDKNDVDTSEGLV